MPDSTHIEKKFKCTVCGSFAEGEITSDSYCTICGAEGDDTWAECEVKKIPKRKLPPRLPKPDIATDKGLIITPPLITSSSDDGFAKHKTITITSRQPGCPIYYTLDGSNPTRLSKVYEQPFEIYETTIVKAAAFKGKLHSKIVTEIFHRKNPMHCPEILPSGGRLYAPVRVSIVNRWTGAVVYYSTDDGVIRQYREPFLVSTSTRIRAYAAKDGRNTDIVTAEFYTERPRYYSDPSKPYRSPHSPFPERERPEIPEPRKEPSWMGGTSPEVWQFFLGVVFLIIYLLMEGCRR